MICTRSWAQGSKTSPKRNWPTRASVMDLLYPLTAIPITGGSGSGAWEESSTVSGGYNNIAKAKYSWIGGGAHNITSAPAWSSAILGGEKHETTSAFEVDD